MLAWDRATRGEHGGNRNPEGRNQHKKFEPDAETNDVQDVVKLDNIQLDHKKTVAAPTGTSANAGLRRLDKAAEAGDESAADLLRRVNDPNDPMTVNGACVSMGWRKPTGVSAGSAARGLRILRRSSFGVTSDRPPRAARWSPPCQRQHLVATGQLTH